MDPGGVQLDVAKDDHRQMRLEDVRQEWLVHPGTADGAAGVAEDGVKDPETSPARRGDVRAPDRAEHRRLLPRAQRGDRLHPAAVFVAEGEPVKEIFDREETGALEVRGFARTDAL